MILVFFLVSILLSCIVTISTPICPESFKCPDLPSFKYPFYNVTDTRCGLIKIDCTPKGGKIQLAGGSFDIVGKFDFDHISNNYSYYNIVISNKTFGNLVKKNSCETLMNNLTPQSPSPLLYSISIYPSITLFKCKNNPASTLQQTDAYFYPRGYKSYNRCKNYTFYYNYSNGTVPNNLPRACQVVHLPVKSPSNPGVDETNIFSLLSSSPSIWFKLSPSCGGCFKNGQRCDSQNGEVHCYDIKVVKQDREPTPASLSSEMNEKFNPKEFQTQPLSHGYVRPLVVSQPSTPPVHVYDDGPPPSVASARPLSVSQPPTGHVLEDGQPPSHNDAARRRIASQTGISFQIMVSSGSAVIHKGWPVCKRNPFSSVSSWNKSPHSKSGVPMSHEHTNLSYVGVFFFTYNELEDATQNFDPSRELGKGGFGVVYYGKLRDGRVVAVKKLHKQNNNYKLLKRFMNEVAILSHIRHRNLVSLYGCTTHHSRELLLVYEYVSNGTVADHLHGKLANANLLTWTIRMNISIETARALAYLHESDIIHRDVKTNNILLDHNLCVKVADFGLSRLMPINVSHVSSAPQGTPGYLDPEYHQCYLLTAKSDVYSFGVVLVELISSMVAFDIRRSPEEKILADFALNRIQRGEVDQLIYRHLDTNPKTLSMIISVVNLAFRCLQYDSEMRPTMNEVLDVLMDIQAGGRIDAYDSFSDLHTNVYTAGQPSYIGVVQPFETGHVYTASQPRSIGAVRPHMVSQPSDTDHVETDGQPPSLNDAARRITSQTGTSLKILASSLIREQTSEPHPKSDVCLTATPSSMSHDEDTNLVSCGGVSFFTYKELEYVTKHVYYLHELGYGRFGVVYHGKLQDGREVAVKKLYNYNYNLVQQIMYEVDVLTCLRHRNLVSLYGFSSSRSHDELLLVYEYVPNGVVADHLDVELGNPYLLTWPIRMNIAIETAGALVYLHACEVIHGDVKTRNVLLDHNFSVKVADFGLSRLKPNDVDVTDVPTNLPGTPGYLDPEYHQFYRLTEKSDVYSFGVVLIELISSMAAIDISRSRDEINLANFALNRIQKGAVDQLIDPDLVTNPETMNMITVVAKLAFRCLQYDSKKRPTIHEVLDVLMDIQALRGVEACDSTITDLQRSDSVVLLKDILPSPISVNSEWQSNNRLNNAKNGKNGITKYIKDIWNKPYKAVRKKIKKAL